MFIYQIGHFRSHIQKNEKDIYVQKVAFLKKNCHLNLRAVPIRKKDNACFYQTKPRKKQECIGGTPNLEAQHSEDQTKTANNVHNQDREAEKDSDIFFQKQPKLNKYA